MAWLARIVLIAAALVSLAMAVTTLLAIVELVLALRPRPDTGSALARMSFDGPSFTVSAALVQAAFFIVSTAAFVASVRAHRSTAWCRKAGVALVLLALPYAYGAVMQFIHISPSSAVSLAVIAAVWTTLAAGCLWIARARHGQQA